jgi:predicted phage terminase large subunit-like protein
MSEITKKEINAILRTDFAAFVRKVFSTISPATEYQHNWHIDCIAHHLKLCEEKKIKRLIINLPPRYLKSVIVNVAWTAWLLGHDASRRIISASYSQTLSRKHSVDTRVILQSEWFKELFPKFQFSEDFNTKDKYITSERGHRIATAVDGSLTGEGGDFLICDDALNAVDMHSKLAIESANNWFDQSFITRLNSKENGVIVVIMQRLHENDLTGHLLKKGGWHHLIIPAEFSEEVIYDCGYKKTLKKGDVLHRERESEELLKATAIAMGGRAYAGQYLQKPASEDGNIIKNAWIKYYKLNDSYAMPECYQSWDTAIKDGEENDYSVCTDWNVKDNNFYCSGLFREKLQYPDLKKAIVARYERAIHKPQAILIEDKSSGQQVLQELRRDTNLPLIAINPKLDKIARVSMASIHFETGRVHLPNDANWLEDMMYEFKLFPNSTNDDIIDSVSQFLNWYHGRKQFKIRQL